MKNIFHKTAAYLALILLSSIPLSSDVIEDATKQTALFRFAFDDNTKTKS